MLGRTLQVRGARCCRSHESAAADALTQQPPLAHQPGGSRPWVAGQCQHPNADGPAGGCHRCERTPPAFHPQGPRVPQVGAQQRAQQRPHGAGKVQQAKGAAAAVSRVQVGGQALSSGDEQRQAGGRDEVGGRGGGGQVGQGRSPVILWQQTEAQDVAQQCKPPRRCLTQRRWQPRREGPAAGAGRSGVHGRPWNAVHHKQCWQRLTARTRRLSPHRLQATTRLMDGVGGGKAQAHGSPQERAARYDANTIHSVTQHACTGARPRRTATGVCKHQHAQQAGNVCAA